jgi:hypothetical protein
MAIQDRAEGSLRITTTEAIARSARRALGAVVPSDRDDLRAIAAAVNRRLHVEHP